MLFEPSDDPKASKARADKTQAVDTAQSCVSTKAQNPPQGSQRPPALQQHGEQQQQATGQSSGDGGGTQERANER
ncbi:MAG: hypothetical protein M1831_001715 [Alyxoria varia]|nr:MAG: hypothetical protein M1831_001715 [Alyxoria varia]